jgi:hypothetical protein
MEALRLSPYESAFNFGQMEIGEERDSQERLRQRLAMLAGAGGPYGTTVGQQPVVRGGGGGFGSLLGTGLGIAGSLMGGPVGGFAGSAFGNAVGTGIGGGGGAGPFMSTPGGFQFGF